VYNLSTHEKSGRSTGESTVETLKRRYENLSKDPERSTDGGRTVPGRL